MSKMVVYVHPKLKEEIPVLFVVAGNLAVKRKHLALERLIKAEAPGILNTDADRRRILDSFDLLHDRFGDQEPSPAAPQHLYNFLTERKRLMQINALVDAYNLISLKYALALGAHDLSHVDGRVSFNLTTGNELFIPLGATAPEPVTPGEYAYMDEREILCRLDVKQCEKTKVTTETRDCIFIIQGNSATPLEYLRQAASELIDLVAAYCGGSAHLADTKLLDGHLLSV